MGDGRRGRPPSGSTTASSISSDQCWSSIRLGPMRWLFTRCSRAGPIATVSPGSGSSRWPELAATKERTFQRASGCWSCWGWSRSMSCYFAGTNIQTSNLYTLLTPPLTRREIDPDPANWPPPAARWSSSARGRTASVTDARPAAEQWAMRRRLAPRAHRPVPMGVAADTTPGVMPTPTPRHGGHHPRVALTPQEGNTYRRTHKEGGISQTQDGKTSRRPGRPLTGRPRTPTYRLPDSGVDVHDRRDRAHEPAGLGRHPRRAGAPRRRRPRRAGELAAAGRADRPRRPDAGPRRAERRYPGPHRDASPASRARRADATIGAPVGVSVKVMGDRRFAGVSVRCAHGGGWQGIEDPVSLPPRTAATPHSSPRLTRHTSHVRHPRGLARAGKRHQRVATVRSRPRRTTRLSPRRWRH